nr:uncharacterized mitochondrial protein AtMg00810-like [Tanacetum cinerariifolium]
MTGNISYLSDFEVINRGYVAFGRNPKGGKITGKSKIKTGKLDFDDVYFVKELKFNLFSVSQMCDKTNSVLFTDTECVVLSSDFKGISDYALNKTPYELLLGKTPSIGFMRPFGCPVTILNTLHPLGKFDGKADEGFWVRYSVNSNAFRVFNSRTKIVHETLHINFLEKEPNVAGRNQPNYNAGIQENLDAGKVGKETVSTQQYALLPLWYTSSKDLQNTDDADAFDVKDNETKVYVSPSSSDKPKKHDKKAKREAKGKTVTVVGPNSTNSTNSFNAAGPFDNIVGPYFEIGGKSLFVDPSQYPDDLDMPALEHIVYSDDKEDVGAEADFSNLEISITTRSMARMVKEQGGLNQIHDKAFHTYGKSASTPIDTEKPLLKDLDGEDVDVHIYRYLKRKPHLGLWYPKDSPFNLVAYYDSDYVEASLDRKSTIGGCQFLGCRVISWQCKKQTTVATLSTEAEYVAAASYCGQVLWIQNHIITVVSYKLMLFGLMKDVVHLMLLEFARMGYEKPPFKLTFYKAFFSAQWKFLIHTIVQCMSAKRIAWNGFSSSMTSAVICLAIGRKFNFSKYIFDSMVRDVDSPSKFLMYPWFLQVMINAQVNDFSSHNNKYTSSAFTQKVFANMRRIGKGFSGVETPLFDTMLVQLQVQDAAEVEEDEDDHETCATLTQKVAHLEQDKVAQALEIVKLKQRVKKLEKKRRSKHSGLKRLRRLVHHKRVESSNDTVMDAQKDASKQGRTAELDADEDVTLVDVDTIVRIDADTQGRMEEDVTAVKEVNAVKPTVFDDEKMQEKHLDNIKKYQSLKRKPFSVAQAKKNMIVYLKNLARYKIQHFKVMTYDQESFKNLRAEVEVLGSSSIQQDTPTVDPAKISKEDMQNMLQIILVAEFKVEDLQVKYPLIDWEIHLKDQDLIGKLSELKSRVVVGMNGGGWREVVGYGGKAGEWEKWGLRRWRENGRVYSTFECGLGTEAQQMQQIQDKAKMSCMVSFQQLHSHLKRLLQNVLQGTQTESGFKHAFATLSGQDIETFSGTMFLNVEQLEKQLDKEDFQEIGSMTAFIVLETQQQKKKIDMSKALDATLVDTKSSKTESKEQDTSSRSWNDAHDDDADIKPIYDEELMAKVQMTAEFNVFAIGQQHSEQLEFNNEEEVDQNVEECHETCPLPAILTDN